MIRKIITYGDNFVNFYKSQDRKIQEKIEYVLDLVRFEKQVPIKFFKYLVSAQGEKHPQVKLYKILAFGDERFAKFCKRQQRSYCNQTNLANYFKTTTATIHNRLKQLQIAFNSFKLTQPKETSVVYWQRTRK